MSQKHTEKLELMFDAFVSALEEGEILKDPSMNFPRICEKLGLDAPSLDAMVRRDFGRSGAEIVDSWRGNIKLNED